MEAVEEMRTDLSMLLVHVEIINLSLKIKRHFLLHKTVKS